MIERNNTSVTLDRIFEDIYNLVTEANRIPLTDKVIIEANDLADALDELKAAIPKEVRNASQVLEEQKSIVNKAYEDADRIVEQAKAEAERIVAIAEAEAERMIKQEEIVKEASAIAEEIKANALRYQEEVKAEAEDFANVTKLEALQYVDNMLEFFETRFSEDLKTLATNRDSVLFEIQKLNTVGKKAVAQVDEEE
jgi:cell division septum initiation protein DivIVA